MNPTIGLYLGGFSSFNVDRTTKNVGNMLEEEFNLDLITTTPEGFSENTLDSYTVYGSEYPQTTIGAVGALREYLSENNPDIITQIGDVPIYGNIISLLKNSETEFVCRFSGDLFYEYQLEQGLERIKIFMLKNILGRLPLYTAERFICMGPREKKKLVDRGVKPTNVGVLPPPVDSSRFVKTKKIDLEIPDDRSVVLFVGRVSRLKGAGTLETAIPQILSERPDLQFVLVGEVQYDLEIPDRFRDQVTVVGRVQPSEIPHYFALADLYVHPSLTEGVSRSVIEALLSDTRVIARDVGDLSYVTSNLFLTDDDFIDMVCRFESLPYESGDRFTVESLQPKYIEFFKSITERT